MQPFWYKHTKLRQHRWIHQIDCQLEPRSLTNSCCTIEVLPGTQGKLMLLALGFPWFFLCFFTDLMTPKSDGAQNFWPSGSVVKHWTGWTPINFLMIFVYLTWSDRNSVGPAFGLDAPFANSSPVHNEFPPSAGRSHNDSQCTGHHLLWVFHLLRGVWNRCWMRLKRRSKRSKTRRNSELGIFASQVGNRSDCGVASWIRWVYNRGVEPMDGVISITSKIANWIMGKAIMNLIGFVSEITWCREINIHFQQPVRNECKWYTKTHPIFCQSDLIGSMFCGLLMSFLFVLQQC